MLAYTEKVFHRCENLSMHNSTLQSARGENLSMHNSTLQSARVDLNNEDVFVEENCDHEGKKILCFCSIAQKNCFYGTLGLIYTITFAKNSI